MDAPGSPHGLRGGAATVEVASGVVNTIETSKAFQTITYVDKIICTTGPRRVVPIERIIDFTRASCNGKLELHTPRIGLNLPVCHLRAREPARIRRHVSDPVAVDVDPDRRCRLERTPIPGGTGHV